MRFRTIGLAVEAVVRMHPGRVRGIGAPIRRDNRDARRNGFAALVRDVEFERAMRNEEISGTYGDVGDLAADERLHPNRGVAAFVHDERDAPAVGRPAWFPDVVIAVAQRKRFRIAADAGHPQLVPLATGVGGIRHALAVGRDVRLGPPAGLLASHEHWFVCVVEVVDPELARAVGRFGIGNDQQASAVGRPGRAQFVVVFAVVVARCAAAAIRRDRLGLESAAVHAPDVHLEAAGIACRNERDSLAVRRPARVCIDGTLVGQRRDLAAADIEHLQLDGFAIVAREHDSLAVGRDVRLVVVTGPRRQLARGAAVEGLQPETALHRIDERVAIRHPRERPGPRRESGQVHFPKIVVVRYADLREDRRAVCDRAAAHHEQQRGGNPCCRTQRGGPGQKRRAIRRPMVRGRLTPISVSWKISSNGSS